MQPQPRREKRPKKERTDSIRKALGRDSHERRQREWRRPGRKGQEGDPKMTTVTRDQFAILGKRLRHVPTGARFSVGSDVINWGRAGDVLPNGDDFEREDIRRVAIEIMREIADE
jgi:hypothetical protein